MDGKSNGTDRRVSQTASPCAAKLAPEHLVQLFDAPESRSVSIAKFAADGLAASENVLLAVTASHWFRVKTELTRLGVGVPKALGDGRITMLDACATLDRISRNGYPEGDAFENVIGALVEELTARAPLRIYGELVDLLAADGDFHAAIALEEMWNRLAARIPFRLYCGYTSAHFGDPRSRAALQRICRTHTHRHSSPEDQLGHWLVSAST